MLPGILFVRIKENTMKLKITTLIENRSDLDHDLKNEHGLSMLIQTKGCTILFDTAQTGAFIENAKKLNIELKQIDHVILSHGHYDHSGGFERLVPFISPEAGIIIGEGFFDPKYKRVADNQFVYNGVSFSKQQLMNLPQSVRTITEEVTNLNSEIILFRKFKQIKNYEKVNPKFYKETKIGLIQDMFEDELVLGICLEEGLVAVVGCSHVGISSILDSIVERTGKTILAVIGGLHLIEADEERINQTIQEFRNKRIQRIAVSHCTGDIAVKKMNEEMSDRFEYNNTGHVIEFS